MRVAVFGEGVHSERYMDAFFFYRDDIDVVSVNKREIENIKADFLVISEPFMLDDIGESKSDLLRKFRSIIFEKLPSHSVTKFKLIEEYLHNNKIMTVHNRLFCKQCIDSNDIGSVDIKWPNLIQSHMDPYWNTLPNVLDFIFLNEGSFPKLDNSYCVLTGDELQFATDIGERTYKVDIYSGDICDKVRVNGMELPWPNYIECYHKAFEAFQDETKRRKYIEYTLKEIDFLAQLRKSSQS